MNSVPHSSDRETLTVGPPVQSFAGEGRPRRQSGKRGKRANLDAPGASVPAPLSQLAAQLTPSARLQLIAKLLPRLSHDELVGLAEMILQRLRGKKAS
jgi:hypothetical protein